MEYKICKKPIDYQSKYLSEKICQLCRYKITDHDKQSNTYIKQMYTKKYCHDPVYVHTKLNINDGDKLCANCGDYKYNHKCK